VCCSVRRKLVPFDRYMDTSARVMLLVFRITCHSEAELHMWQGIMLQREPSVPIIIYNCRADSPKKGAL